ncbi:MAG: flagellar hook-basal body protein [Firmicutes bacterium]|nr:flagellar hook-basal body protein [Bacillota bacterium]
MLQALLNGASGMQAQQKKVDSIAENIANINTVGYMKTRIDFKDAVYSAMIDPSNPGSAENLLCGNGVLMGQATKINTRPIYYETDNPLDLSITDSGFFAVVRDGNIYYTKDGSFKASETDGEIFLVTNGGQNVLDSELQPIRLYGNPSETVIDAEGYITAEGEQQPYAQIAVFDFANDGALYSVGGNFYEETEASGQAEPALRPNIKQKSLEGSNVDLADEMTQLIKAQRAYQMASKVITTADEMEGLANNLRG